MTTLRNLNRAVQSAEFPSHEWAQAVREWIGKATAKMEWEPASEGAKVDPFAIQSMEDAMAESLRMIGGESVQTEPAAPVGEMPEAVRTAAWRLRNLDDWTDADNLETFWRTHAAQPSCSGDELAEAYEKGWKAGKLDQRDAAQPKVAMTEELERVLLFAADTCTMRPEEGWRKSKRTEMLHTIAAVRAQAAGVRLPKVRALIEEVSSDRYDGKQYRHLLTAALAELDRLERKP